MIQGTAVLRVRQHLGKYRIDGRIAEGGFAAVFKAFDTIAGLPVALKVPNAGVMTKEVLANFRHEVRLNSKLDHPNILPVKDAGFVDGVFVIAYPLGDRTLGDRLERRLSMKLAVDFVEQMLAAVAFAHTKRVMHCDIKPENFILFPGNRLRLADFGIAKIARRTIEASGSGTVGYLAPEQAMGKPSFRSDVFSLGLILYRMFAGHLPEWPFDWPPAGYDRLRRNLHPDVIRFLQRSMQVDHRKRFTDAVQMAEQFKRLKGRLQRSVISVRRRRRKQKTQPQHTWRAVRFTEFLRRYRGELELRDTCRRCQGPVADAMKQCPWCGCDHRVIEPSTHWPGQCPRCKRGMKSDWRYCPWCYGSAVQEECAPRYSDGRYVARCDGARCPGRDLMPFMQYCPWCRRKVRRAWPLIGSRDRCPRCRWGVCRDYWDYCPWCSRTLGKR